MVFHVLDSKPSMSGSVRAIIGFKNDKRTFFKKCNFARVDRYLTRQICLNECDFKIFTPSSENLLWFKNIHLIFDKYQNEGGGGSLPCSFARN
jgi:hypothetical protein